MNRLGGVDSTRSRMRAVGLHLGSGLTALGAWAVLVTACSDPPPTERATVSPPVQPALASPAPGSAVATSAKAVAETSRASSRGVAILCADTDRSGVRWRGTKVGGGKHEGVVRLAGGRLLMRDGSVAGGSFTVDMRSIAITDIPPHEVEARRQLRQHLAHEEFFGVERFPTARFEITRVEGGEHGIYTISGNLAIRDSVHNVTFDATAPFVTPERVWASADFGIDRQLWGIEFDGRTSTLRNAIVHDLIQLELTLVADAKGGC